MGSKTDTTKVKNFIKLSGFKTRFCSSVFSNIFLLRMGFSLALSHTYWVYLFLFPRAGPSHHLDLAPATQPAFIHSQMYTQVELGEMVAYNSECLPLWNLYFRCIRDSLDGGDPPSPPAVSSDSIPLPFTGNVSPHPACLAVIKPQVISPGARNLEWWFSESPEGFITHRSLGPTPRPSH